MCVWSGGARVERKPLFSIPPPLPIFCYFLQWRRGICHLEKKKWKEKQRRGYCLKCCGGTYICNGTIHYNLYKKLSIVFCVCVWLIIHTILKRKKKKNLASAEFSGLEDERNLIDFETESLVFTSRRDVFGHESSRCSCCCRRCSPSRQSRSTG